MSGRVLRAVLRVFLVLGVTAASGGAGAAVGGRYISPLGDLQLKAKGNKLSGVTAEAGGPCGFKKGQEVLQGTLMDDSVTGTLSICSQGPGCGTQKVLVVLLVARKGELLSGAVHAKQAGCKLPLGGKGIALARAPEEPKHAKPKPRPAPRPRPEEPAAAPVADTEIEAPFEAWNPDSLGGGTPQGRRQALALGREAGGMINRGDFEGARSVLMQALRHNPAYAEGYNMMGVTFFARDRYDDALGWYKKALTANPDFGDAYYNIACIYAVEGKKNLALRYLRIAMLNGYAQVDVVAKDPDLDSLRGEPEYKEIVAVTKAEPPAAPEPAPAPDAGPAEAPDAAAPVTPAAPAEDGPPPPDAPIPTPPG